MAGRSLSPYKPEFHRAMWNSGIRRSLPSHSGNQELASLNDAKDGDSESEYDANWKASRSIHCPFGKRNPKPVMELALDNANRDCTICL